MTGGTAIKLADERANTAVVAALTPICVEKFLQNSDAKANLAVLQKISSHWEQGDYCKRAAGRRSRGLPPPTTTWPGRAQRSGSKTKLRPNELNRRTSTAALSRHSLGSPADWPEQRRTLKSQKYRRRVPMIDTE
jgi:hypothetical protein